jgi:hypothetical protein
MRSGMDHSAFSMTADRVDLQGKFLPRGLVFESVKRLR